MTDYFETSDGVKLAYRIDGPKDGPCVMFSNSLATDMSMWDQQIEAFTDRYRMLRYDKRGHGQSDRFDTPITMQNLADDAVALAQATGFADGHFVGLSIGGMTGQAVGLYHPGVFKSLSLCMTSSQIPEAAHEAWAERLRMAREDGMVSLAAPTLERWFTEDYRTGNPDAIEKIANMIRNTSVSGYTRCSEAILGMAFTDRLGDITDPVLVLPGENDPGLPPLMSEVIRDGIPGAQYDMVMGAAHLANIQEPDQFNRIVRNFIDSVEDA